MRREVGIELYVMRGIIFSNIVSKQNNSPQDEHPSYLGLPL